MESFSSYNFEIKSHDIPGYGENVDERVKGYFYVIYNISYVLILHSNEYFETSNEARLAAIGHISLLEKRGI